MFDIFLFFSQNIDCGYSLEPPRRGGVKRVPTIYVLNKNNKHIFFFSPESFQFLELKNLCVLHRQVFVMKCQQIFVVGFGSDHVSVLDLCLPLNFPHKRPREFKA